MGGHFFMDGISERDGSLNRYNDGAIQKVDKTGMPYLVFCKDMQPDEMLNCVSQKVSTDKNLNKNLEAIAVKFSELGQLDIEKTNKNESRRLRFSYLLMQAILPDLTENQREYKPLADHQAKNLICAIFDLIKDEKNFNDDAMENLSVSFYAARTNTATTSIGYITNVSNASSFVSKQSFSCGTSIGGPYSYDFSNAGSIPAGARIAISYTGQSYKSCYLFIDDLTVTSTTIPSACKKPKNLIQGTVTTTSASFTWAQGASEEAWQYVCLPASATLDWTGAETSNSESATVSGLTAGTKYRFYVRSDCGSEKSSATSAEFRTVYALPFSENFTGLTSGIPEGWDNSEGTTTTPSGACSKHS